MPAMDSSPAPIIETASADTWTTRKGAGGKQKTNPLQAALLHGRLSALF
jgi:hypothetical protein